MGNVSLFEDISDRLTDDAINVTVARNRMASIKHFPDGPGARSPRLRFEIASMWQDFENAIRPSMLASIDRFRRIVRSE
ncbi:MULTISPECIES: hypothetical protein [unclassified Mesorhizobium]|uniref:hypothetical protein n=1 Tax=unclassified Mesorhizobium TaxID=325217 RepID=UPI0003D01E28|nr:MULTISPECIES: hypothetical protein [unclassified Mesorhizobium]ESZ05403.1 hypothetical protein X736_19770 [Mesorhizobium sp. L2C089B000]WJI49315.1 hypothetical protein NLY44_22060 [Mesorhizobium sp. C089B]